MYIDPTTELPQNLAEIYSDRNLRIVGQARINPTNSNQIDLLDVKVYCSPIQGGAEGVSIIADGSYILSGIGSSMWIKVTRTGTETVTPEIYVAGSQPKSRRDYVQVFYRTGANQIVGISSFLIYQGSLYTRFGYGNGQRIYDAIVGNSGDDHVTHTDLQTAINDTPDNGWILVRKMCLVDSTITTASKSIKFVFEGHGTGLSANGATTGIIFEAEGCQLVGFGTISGFTTGVDLNGLVGSRIEMVFSGNSTNVDTTDLSGLQYSLAGSYGLFEDSHIQTSTTHGTVARWNNISKRWEPVTGITIDDTGKLITIGDIEAQEITATGTISGNIVIGAVYNA